MHMLLRSTLARLGRVIWLRLAARTILLPLRSLLRSLVRRLPRDPGLLVFGAPLGRFADNAAYLFLDADGALEHYRRVWITPSRSVRDRLRAAGYEAETKWSPRGVRRCLSAGMYLYSAYPSDINRWLYDGAVMFNLWHGVPLKRIERDRTNRTAEHRSDALSRRAFADEQVVPDLLLSPSAFISRRCFQSAFAVPPQRCVDAGYPRTDHFAVPLRPSPIVEVLPSRDQWYRLAEERLVVGYFPTWRDSPEALAGSEGDAVLRRLAVEAQRRGGVVVFKPHGNTADAPDTRRLAGVVTLDDADDVHAFLPLCHLLITDYSSIAFDFMLLERPIIYHVPDLEAYKRYPGLYFDAGEAMPGVMTRTSDELCRAVRSADLADPGRQVRVIKRMTWQDNDAGSVSRIADRIDSALRRHPTVPPVAGPGGRESSSSHEGSRTRRLDERQHAGFADADR